jgi:HEAT repeat protein
MRYIVPVLCFTLFLLNLDTSLYAQDKKAADSENASDNGSGKDLDQYLKDLKEGSVDQRIAAIVALGDQANQLDKILKPLLDQQKHIDPMVNYAATSVLKELAPLADNQIKQWLESKDPNDLIAAGSLLTHIGPNAKKHLDTLDTFLKTDEFTKKMVALFVIEQIGEPAKSTIPNILPCLKSETPNVRYHGIIALGEIGDDDQKVIDALRDRFDNGDLSERSLSGIALAKLKSTNDYDLVSELTERANKRFTVVEKGRAIEALGIKGADAADALDDIQKAFNDQSLRVSAAIAHWQISGDPTQATTQLGKMLNDDVHSLEAIQALGKMGDSASSQIDALIKVGKTNDEGLRVYVIEALAKIDPMDGRVQEFLNDSAKQDMPLAKWLAKKYL